MASSSDNKSKKSSKVFVPTLTPTEAAGSYLWEVEDQKQVSDFLSADNGKRLKSLPFSIGKLQWLLEAFPNGDRKDNEGSFMVYLTLIQLPREWQRVTFLLRLFNAETSSSFTGIATYTKTSNSGGWSDGTLMLNDLKQSIANTTNKISLGCRINILQLVGSGHETKLYQYPLKTEYINIMKSKSPVFNIKWVVNEELLQKFKTANVGKKFESEIFYDSWSLRCAPNGKREHDANNIKLYLLLCALPPNIVHCKVKYTLSCDEAQVQWVNTRDFSYIYPNVGWPNGTMSTKDIKDSNGKYKDLKQLTFRARIEIIKLYDTDILSSDDDSSGEDDDEDDSSSYDSSENPEDGGKNEDDGLGSINRDIMDRSSNESGKHAQRRKSAAKKSDMKRRQSHEIISPPHLPQSITPTVESKYTSSQHSRQETDMNTMQEFMLNKLGATGGGTQMPSGGMYGHGGGGHGGGKPDSPFPLMNGQNGSSGMMSSSPQNHIEPGFQMRSRQVTDVNLIQQFMQQQQQLGMMGYHDRGRTGTVIERQMSDDDKKHLEHNDEMLLEYDERINVLEQGFKSLSNQLHLVMQQLKNVNQQNDLYDDDEMKYGDDRGNNNKRKSNMDIDKVLNGIKSDICLIKNKLIDDKSLNKKQEKIKNWLNDKVELPQYFDIFIENGLDEMDIIKDINDDELLSIGITKLGHRKKIMKYIQVLNK